jgi:hypothetical protein
VLVPGQVGHPFRSEVGRWFRFEAGVRWAEAGAIQRGRVPQR